MESYHVVETHFDGMPIMGSVATQIDIWSEGSGYVSRLVAPGMTRDPYIADRVTTPEGLSLYCHWHGLPQPPDGSGADPASARRYAATVERARLEQATGRDYSKEPVSFFLDMGKYFMFPNYHPWWGEGIPWWYNFTPIGRDPDKSLMEMRVLRPIPKDGKHPPMPEPIVIEFGQRATDNPALGGLGHIIDQDLANMSAIQQGFKAASPDHAYLTLSNYQEGKIRRFHEIYDDLLGLDVNG
jgi:hypothetical protein